MSNGVTSGSTQAAATGIPGLVITWRRSADGEWEAYVATTSKFGSALVTWAPALSLHPVTDDRWEEPHPPTR
jgi:hypothetical protein